MVFARKEPLATALYLVNLGIGSVRQKQYMPDQSAGQAENSTGAQTCATADTAVGTSGWRLDKIRKRAFDDPVWKLSAGNASLKLTTRTLIDGDRVWVKIFCLTHDKPPFPLGDSEAYRQWLAPLLAECPI
jgi:hypothetical protein